MSKALVCSRSPACCIPLLPLAQVRFPMDQVDPFRCAEPELHAAYKHRHLRAAFCNVQHQKDQPAVTTKVPLRRLPSFMFCITAT